MSGNSFASIARLAFTAGGYYFGGPIGGALAGAASTVLFPGELPGVRGPRLGPDQPTTTASIGQAIPILYGTIDVPGNIIQDLGREEIVSTSEQGGKGAPSQDVTTYTYKRTYAILLCEGPIDGVVRIWRNAKLVYDLRPQMPDESDAEYSVRIAASEGYSSRFGLYLGTDSQAPDPTLEAAVGMGLQPAYRGRAYIVMYDEDVTDNGGRPSQWKFEVAATGSFSQTPVVQRSPGVLYPWVSSLTDCRNFFNRHEYTIGIGGWQSSFDDVQAQLNAQMSTAYDFDADYRYLVGWTNGESTYPTADGPYLGTDLNNDPGDRTSALLHLSMEQPVGYIDELPAALNFVSCDEFYALAPFENVHMRYWRGYSDTGLNLVGGGVRYVKVYDGLNNPPFPWYTAADNSCVGPSWDPDFSVYVHYSQGIAVRRKPGAPPYPCATYPSLPENPEYCVLPGGAAESKAGWDLVTVPSGFKTLCALYQEPGGYVQRYPLGPILPVGHADDNEEFWTQARDDAVEAGDLPPEALDWFFSPAGQSPGTDYFPIRQDECFVRVTHSAEGYGLPVPLSSIVADICRRAGIVNPDDIDVTDLIEGVRGFRVDRIMTARDAIEPLQRYGYFDCVDGERLRFCTRGRAVVADLGDDELSAHMDGEECPPLVETTRVEDVELPRFLGVRYPMPDADYQVGMQQEDRIVVANVEKTYLDMPIAMTDDKARQIAQVLLSEAWTARETYKFIVTPRMLALEAADNVTVPVFGEPTRCMIRSISGGYPGPLTVEAARNDASDYTSTVAGVVSGVQPQPFGVAGVTLYVFIDGPALDERHDDPGFYVAACGTGDRWRGASLYESPDDGDNYTRVLGINLPSTMGAIVDALPPGPHSVWDESNELFVTLSSGALESRTEMAVLNGANAAFVGAHGRWELIQYRSAELVGPMQYKLTGLLRGRRGTEWAIGTSEAGDTFALCTTLQRIPRSASAIGITYYYKVVSNRSLIEGADIATFATEGVALECYAPGHVLADRDEDGNLTVTIIRRARLGPEWIDYADVPLNEDSEHYQLDIYDGDEVVRTIDAFTPEASYSAAQQVDDFGAPVPYSALRVIAYQMSATTGRGYPTEATI